MLQACNFLESLQRQQQQGFSRKRGLAGCLLVNDKKAGKAR